MAVLTAPLIELPDDAEALLELSLKEKWGDGAPLIPPTDARIEALLAAVPLPRDHVFGPMAPRNGIATLELVAINAAMAGVTPRAFPVVIAALEAILRPKLNLYGISTTTSSVMPFILVNGATRDELGIDYGPGCMGGAAGRGSMSIGRALSLCMRNIGGQRAGENSRTVFGQPGRFGTCFAEWEEKSPWPPLSVWRGGFAPGQEVVSVHCSKGTTAVCDINNDDAEDLVYMIAKAVASPMGNWFAMPAAVTSQTVVCINPVWAERIARRFPKVGDLQAYMWEWAWYPIEHWRPANQAVLRKNGRVDGQGRVRACARPDQLIPFVCGGLGSLHTVILPTWGDNEMEQVAVQR
jgi:hypothetical protein